MAATRIPLALQQVFLTSNAGEEVDEAPAGNVASKLFFTDYAPKMAWSIGTTNKQKRASQGSLKDTLGGSPANTKLRVEKDEASTDATDEIHCRTQIEAMEITDDHTSSHEEISKIPPQEYLNGLLTSRGYSAASRNTLETGYYATPTHFQQASYHGHLISLARAGKKNELREILACGISPNPCNTFGESLVHTICRRCDPETLQLFVDAGASLQISDDYGRTPLHDACWRPEPCFEIIEMIAGNDLNLFLMADSRGALPLTYVSEGHWGRWNQFLESKKDTWWPRGILQLRSLIADLPPNTRPIKDPEDALQPDIAAMLTSGRITPKEAINLKRNVNNKHLRAEEIDDFSDDCSYLSGSHSSESSDEDSYSDDDDFHTCCLGNEEDYTDSSDDFSLSMNEDDMADMLGIAASAHVFLIPPRF